MSGAMSDRVLDLKLHRSACFGEVPIRSRRPESPTKPRDPPNGTALAVSYLNLGVAAHLPSTARKGGARNRADRESHALTVAHVANLVAASSHATSIGLPFTRMRGGWRALGVHG